MKFPTYGKTQNLEQFFRCQATRWALLGFVVTLTLAVPCILYSAKVASERQLLATARSVTRAFRPLILQYDIRDAEFQMRKALELQPSESAIIYDSNLNSIYPLHDSEKRPRCQLPQRYCWESGFRSVSILYPIYFDSQKEEGVFGYLELKLKPTLDLKILSMLIFLLLAAFIGQAFGMSSALKQSAQQIVGQLSTWADHLRNSPEVQRQTRLRVPFSDLHSMQEAVDGLYFEIERLRKKTEREAKAEAQLSLIREISHDLRTPHALLAKYFALHLDTVVTRGQVNPDEVGQFERTLKRMGDLLRQVRFITPNSELKQNEADQTCALEMETQAILEDLRQDEEVISKQITIESNFGDTSLHAKISKTGYYRILENLVRNAIDAAQPSQGRITVSLHSDGGYPVLSVQDNGCGIAPEIQEKIFAFDFTTKLSRGTGLGLGIADKICKEFGAALQFESEVGKGSKFTILFQPAHPKPEQPNFKESIYAST